MKPLSALLAVLLFVGCQQSPQAGPPTQPTTAQAPKPSPTSPITIDAPVQGSQEWIVYKFFEGAQKAGDEEAWGAVRQLLHSDVLASQDAEDNFRHMNFAAFRRKMRFLTVDGMGAAYRLAETIEDQPDQEHRLFVVNQKSDRPSPFRLARDPRAGNDWRVKTIP